MTGSGFTRALDDLRAADAGAFGGKSTSLGELAAAGAHVPPGFAVAASAFEALLDARGLRDRVHADLERVAHHDVEDVRRVSDAIAAAMRDVPVPDDVRAEVERRYAELAGAAGLEAPPVAVRSSALGEDSAEATFAVQQETFLWVRGSEEVLKALRECWISLYSPSAITYRAKMDSAGASPAMGVTVQLMVDAEVSGVMFTCNPASGDPSVVAINSSWGLGLGVVGGEVTPDDFLVSKVTGEVLRRTISPKAVEYRPASEGTGTVRLEVPSDRAQAPSLEDERLAALVDVGKCIDRHFGARQDVEWAIARGAPFPESLYVLQARPVTAAGAGETKAEAPAGATALALVMGTFGAGTQPPR